MAWEDWKGEPPGFYKCELNRALEALRRAADPELPKRWVVRVPAPSGWDLPSSQDLAAALAASVYAFRADADALLKDLELKVFRDHVKLTVENRTDDEAVRILEGLIELLERPLPRRAGAALRRPWALGTLTVALATVLLSFLSLSAVSLVMLGLIVAGIAGVAVGYAARRRREGLSTCLKMAPVLLMVGFALVYGAAGAGDGCTSTMFARQDASASQPPCEVLSPDTGGHLRDPLILSLQAMVTGGFGDIEAFGWTRSVVYLEMLLLWAGVAIAVVELGRRFQRIDAALAPDEGSEERYQ
jgi:hypothetical protein